MSISVKNKHKSKPEPNDIYIGRGSPLGNPFTHLDLDNTKAQYRCETRDQAIENYEAYLTDKIKENDRRVCDELNRIYLAACSGNVNLVCFCKPKSCHGDIIKRIVEEKINLTEFKKIF